MSTDADATEGPTESPTERPELQVGDRVATPLGLECDVVAVGEHQVCVAFEGKTFVTYPASILRLVRRGSR